MTLRQIVLVGDSLTEAVTPQTPQWQVQAGGKGTWSELVAENLANTAGIGPLLSSGFRGMSRVAGGYEWSYAGTWSATTSADAFDRAPYNAQTKYASGGSTTIATWTKPPQWRSVVGFAIYFVDYTAGGNWQYRVDGGTWINMGQTRTSDNKLAKFYVANNVTSTVDIRAYNGSAACGVCIAGIEAFYSDPRGVTQGLIVHNIGKGGEPLANLVLAGTGDRMALFDSVKVDLTNGGGAITNQPNAAIIMMHVNDVRLYADTTKWANDIAALYARVNTLAPIGYMSYGEMLAPTYDSTVMANYRAQTKTSAALHSIPVLDHFDYWSSNGYGGVGTQCAKIETAGFITTSAAPVDNGHQTQLGHLDMAPRIYWFLRNLMGIGNVPSSYPVKTTPRIDPVVFSLDSFNRANSGSLGSTDGSGSLDPKTWVSTTLGITGNQLYPPSGIGELTNFGIVDLGTPNVDLNITITGVSGTSSMLCRYVDIDNTMQVWMDVSQCFLSRKVGGAGTMIGSNAGGVVAGDKIRLVASGSTYWLYKNGILTSGFPVTDTTYTTQTKHGVTAAYAAGSRLDNWLVSDVVPAPAFVYKTKPSVAGLSLVSADSFNRANSSTVLGSTDGSGNLDPQAWVQNVGTWGIDTNRVYTSAMGSAPNANPVSIASIDSGVSNVEVVGVAGVISGGRIGLIARMSDTANYLFCWINGSTNTIRFYKNSTAGGLQQIGTDIFGSISAADVFRINVNGPIITVYRNNTLLYTINDSFNSTATRCGLWFGDANTSTTLDSFSVNTIVNNLTPVYVAGVPVGIS